MPSLTICVSLVILAASTASQAATKILQSNDDGWAVANIRAQYSALVSAGYDVILSAPAENESGTGSSTTTPTPLTEPCEYDSCPTGSPAEGYNSSNTRLNYVNAYPVDSVKYGIQTLGPKFWSSGPNFVVSGPNVGNNLGSSTVAISGTIGAACEAVKEGYPAVAFSGASGSQVSYTTLSNTSASSTQAANLYSALTVKFTQALLASGTPYLPTGISVNVNYPSITNCASVSNYKFVLTRITANSSATDVTTCGTDHLPAESTVVAASGCYVSVSVFNASTKADVGASTQATVLNKLGSSFFSCY
ncbi:hypothetical protein JAAARDRAFT_60562 [Jaapia argillacea MUCL 33604]|uniref:Survival protein SurE-like phosphatase/nucleotidase domain-containing protein n=1 Tax=Jaapia argillacea MUCL 33604 TaxID=933084 RepID=A0A067PW50_9AGAM|nr:hypothetical protein JAAARDRAFT_60562 [Jaapia argillacea MUCL 33604]